MFTTFLISPYLIKLILYALLRSLYKYHNTSSEKLISSKSCSLIRMGMQIHVWSFLFLSVFAPTRRFSPHSQCGSRVLCPATTVIIDPVQYWNCLISCTFPWGHTLWNLWFLPWASLRPACSLMPRLLGSNKCCSLPLFQHYFLHFQLSKVNRCPKRFNWNSRNEQIIGLKCPLILAVKWSLLPFLSFPLGMWLASSSSVSTLYVVPAHQSPW